MKYLKYFWTVCRHKWYVFVECCKLGIPFLGIIHDWSKFLPAEFFPYAEYFNGGYERGKQPEPVKLAFDFAWKHHQNWNKHHWQSYVLHNDNPDCPEWSVVVVGWDAAGYRDSLIEVEGQVFQILAPYDNYQQVFDISNEMSRLPKILPMPDHYRREMLADWRGAGRAYGNADTKGWYLKNRKNIMLHPETREWVEKQLGIIVEFVGMDHEDNAVST